MAVDKALNLCHTSGGGVVTREQLIDLIRRLPEDKLPGVEALLSGFVDDSEEIVPVSLRGIWAEAGVVITEADIAEARKEMWGNFGERIKIDP